MKKQSVRFSFFKYFGKIERSKGGEAMIAQAFTGGDTRGRENQNNLIKFGGIYVKITYKDFMEIQKLKKQGITRNEAVLKTKYTQYVIYKYWDMPEDVFLKEKDKNFKQLRKKYLKDFSKYDRICQG